MRGSIFGGRRGYDQRRASSASLWRRRDVSKIKIKIKIKIRTRIMTRTRMGILARAEPEMGRLHQKCGRT